MKDTYRQVFAVDTAILTKCQTKHWPLIKLLNRNLTKGKLIIDPIRERLKPPENVAELRRAKMEAQQTMQSAPFTDLQKVLEGLEKEHPEAHTEDLALGKLEQEILDDTLVMDWVTIPESLFHKGENLLIAPEAFLLFSEVGIVVEDAPAPVRSIKTKTKKK